MGTCGRATRGNATDVGPLIDAAAAERMESRVREAVKAGRKVLTGIDL